ncbi:MAG: ABC transporter permease [Thermomicrobia bacterium]|nr:ABC transporter permease [Thermomicrobia bacterium]
MLRRLLSTIPTMLLVTLTVFVILRLTPGGPAVAMLGEQATPQSVAALEHKLGLDRPLYIQYLDWLGHALRGDLGRSAFGNQPVTELIVQRIMPTAELGFLAMVIALVIGIAGGVIAATRHNTGVDAASSFFSILGVSTPSFWLAILLVLVFSIKIPWLPALGYVSPFKDLGSNLKQMILPSFTLGVTLAAIIARITRGAMLDALYQDFVRTARAKGLRERHVVTRHALANALIPVVTVVGLQIAGLLGGAVIIETVFALPGNGQLLVTAIFSRDFPVVQGIVVVTALAFILINLAVDLLYAALDPRIRLS